MPIHLFGLDYQRRRALARCKEGPLNRFLAEPFPNPKTKATSAQLLAVDLETTGLNKLTDRVISIGSVKIDSLSVQLDSAWHQIIQVDRDVSESSAVIHQITDDASASGAHLREAIPELLSRLSGCVMLVHYAKIETSFLNAACNKLYGAKFICPIIDTVDLGLRAMKRAGTFIQPEELRLAKLRSRFNLPAYQAHNALEDALATAELFLALRAELDPQGKSPISDFYLK